MCKKKKEVNYYFKAFMESFNYSIKALEYLEKVVNNFNGGITEKHKDEIHVIEHEADLYLNSVLKKLSREFITPIESEDILAIIKKIDSATDAIEDVLLNAYVFGAKKFPEVSLQFIDIIKRESQALAVVLEEFPNFKRSEVLKDKIMEVLSIEEEGDRLFISSLKELYESSLRTREIHVAESIIRSFEACCDIIEEIAQVIDEAVMKNY
ncbi:MAG TPA: DUF47 family protein [Erysipelotrichaceae bacterium]|nr:DUF47 family protein [Erysipelotrichaceae bacterium]